jgi:mRNA-degrading endonuclease RelE of RelBE toxin-antitoxin system
MRYRVIFSPQARTDFHALSAYDRARIRDLIDKHLSNNPTMESKSRIKRLRGIKKPQYRLRADDIRVFYDVTTDEVVVHGIIDKAHAEQWLQERGERP